MKRFFNWQMALGLSLVMLSSLIYFMHYLVFRDTHHIFIYLVGDIAFVPMEVLFVTLIIHRLLSMREKQVLLNKLNMVIGAFFSEMGTKLLRDFSALDPRGEAARKGLVGMGDWAGEDFIRGSAFLRDYAYSVDALKGNLPELKLFLAQKRAFILRLLQNPNLLEHGSFTNLLWAVSHLTEEIVLRKDPAHLTDPDRGHIEGDITRVYALLASHWLDYMKHLRANYPYLFSLAVRTNPFNPEAAVEIT